MSGGIRRLATAVRKLKGKGILLVNSALISEQNRQDELKLETLGEGLRSAGVNAINVSASEAVLGPSAVGSLMRLSGDTAITSALEPSSTNPLKFSIRAGGYLIGGWTDERRASAALGEAPLSRRGALQRLVDDAKARKLRPALLLDGSEEEAREAAAEAPALELIVYRRSGTPPAAPIKIGKTKLVTPGETGKHMVMLEMQGTKTVGYRVINLGPDLKDDPAVSRIFAYYQQRVRDERLLESLPREQTPGFAGTATCGSCHQKAMDVWKGSKHAIALQTLEKELSDRDPDCTGCHVVDLTSTEGFKSRNDTPDLANVGCESCHGPGKAHSLQPEVVKMGKVGQKVCTTCHTIRNSPRFEFSSYWKRILH